LKKTEQAILLRKTNYSETSLILTFFCRNSGVHNFIFQGGKKKKGNVLYPLSVVEFEYYSRNDTDLGKITALSPEFIFTTIPNHPYKSATLFFIAEILQKTLRQENEKEEDFFLFLVAEIHELDVAPFEANYPLWFLLELSKWIGIEPRIEHEKGQFFDIKEGLITDYTATNSIQIEKGEHIQLLAELFVMSKDTMLRQRLNGKTRNKLLRTFLAYYSEHIQGFTFPKSLEILEEVFQA
jgi:DNA repair protein RecO (recombination protein O)